MAFFSSGTRGDALPLPMASTPGPVLVDIRDRVNEKEAARDLGLIHLAHIAQILKNDQSGQWQDEVADWFDSLEILRQAPKDREVFVGVLGETGLGKSSLINALLGYDIVPTNQSEACTATVCIFGFNHKLLAAKVAFKSWETVEAELDAVKEEIDDLEDTAESEGDVQSPRYQRRLAELMNQIATITMWSGLEEEEIRHMSAEEILTKSNIYKHVFKSGKIDRTQKTYESFQSTKKKVFLDQLAIYVDSSTKSQALGYWPLVEHVEISLRADVLRHGIKLVDLPGDQDFNVSRSQIARSWSYRLDKRIVVTPAARAADNKSAAGFIFSEEDTEDLDVDDLLKGDSLCVAVTKIDEIDTKSARSEFPTKEVLEVCEELQAREDDDEEEEYTEDEDDKSASKAGQKRLSNKEALERDFKKKKLKLESHDLSRLTESELDFRLAHLCIEARNEKIKKRVERDFLEAVKKIKKTSAKQAKMGSMNSVFTLSSKAFQDFRKGKRKGFNSYGFPDRESTGIPALVDWLHQVSLPHREEWVDSDVHHVQVLLNAADGWCQAEDGAYLPRLTRAEIQKLAIMVKPLLDRLGKIVDDRVFNRLRANLSSMRPLRKSNLTRGKFGKNSKEGQEELTQAVSNLLLMVKGWLFKNPHGRTDARDKHKLTHWSTYKACVKRRGGVFCRPGKKGQAKFRVHWMADVQRAFWRGHRERWQGGLMQRIPKLKAGLRGTAQKAFDHWVTTVHADKTLPVFFLDLIKSNIYKLEHLFGKFVAEVRQRLTVFQATCRVLRESILESHLAKHMNSGFEAALEIKGKGILQKQSEEIKRQTEAIGPTMFEDARNQLEQGIVREIGILSRDVRKLWKDKKHGCEARINAEVARLVHRLGSSQISPSSNINVETQQQIFGLIGEWRRCWATIHSQLPRDDSSEELEVDEEQEKLVKIEEDEETGEEYEATRPAFT